MEQPIQELQEKNSSTIRGIIKKKEDILKQAEIMTESGVELKESCRQSRSRAMLKMEKLLVIWLQDLETRNFPVGLAQIQQKARILFLSISEGLKNKSDYEMKLEAKGSKKTSIYSEGI